MNEGTMTAEARAAVVRNAFATAALEAGYDVYLPVCGASADVVIAREQDGVLRPVIISQTLSGDSVIEGVDRWVGFEAAGLWHVAPDGPLLHVATCRLPRRADDAPYVVDLSRLDPQTLEELADYVLTPVPPPPKPDPAPHKPTPWNVALLACFGTLFDRPGYEGGHWVEGKVTGENSFTLGSFAMDAGLTAFREAAVAGGWVSFGWDDEAASIANGETDPVLALRQASARDLGSVVTFVDRSERHSDGAYERATKNGTLLAVTTRAAELADEAAARAEPVLGERVAGALFGAAIGDALGLPVENLDIAEIRKRFGVGGLRGYAEAFGMSGALSGEAQIMVCVASGLSMMSEWEDEETTPSARHLMLFDEAVEIGRVRQACAEWLSGQAGRTDGMGECAVTLHPFLRERRPHGRTTGLALAAGAEQAANDSKGAGCLLRVVPIGLAHLMTMPDEVFRRAWNVAGLTHGHPAAKAAAGVFATLLSRLACRQSLPEAVACALGTAPCDEAGGEIGSLVAKARGLAAAAPPSPEALATIGSGFVAGEALAIAICCVMSTSSFEAAVLAAVNHSGDSDATGGVAGALAGALYGTNAIPLDLLREVEGRDAIVRIAADLTRCTGLGAWTEGGIGENAYEDMITPEDEARSAEAAIREAVQEGEDVEAAIGSFANGYPEVAAKMRHWAKRRRKPRASGQGDLLSG